MAKVKGVAALRARYGLTRWQVFVLTLFVVVVGFIAIMGTLAKFTTSQTTPSSPPYVPVVAPTTLPSLPSFQQSPNYPQGCLAGNLPDCGVISGSS
jgi:hypothetical protein